MNLLPNKSNQSLQQNHFFTKKTSSIFFIIALVIIAVFIIGGSVYLGQKSSIDQRLTQEIVTLRQQFGSLKKELLGCQNNPQIYTIYPGSRYINEKYSFTMDIPKDWFVVEKEDDITREQFITFSNYKNITSFNKLNSPEDFLAYFLLIYPKQNQESFKHYEEELMNRKQAFSEKIEYDAGKNRKIILYIISQSIDTWPSTLDMTLPDAEAFLEDEAYGYYFYNATEIPSGEDGQKKAVEIMKKSLDSFKFDK